MLYCPQSAFSGELHKVYPRQEVCRFLPEEDYGNVCHNHRQRCLPAAFQVFPCAETTVSLSLFYKLFGIRKIQPFFRTEHKDRNPADIGTFIVFKSRKFHCIIYNINRTLNKAFTVGVFNSENKFAVL